MTLSQTEMWEALSNNDPSYDGLFFYGVTSTGIFCRPSCKSKRPVRKNIIYFTDSAVAFKEGYRPCKRCRPDLADTILEPMKELVGEAKQILETEYARLEILKELPRRVGISPVYLQRTYKKLTGISPKSYLDKIRIQKAQDILVNQDLDHVDICFSVGFQSLSSFYKRFRLETGLTPGEYAAQERAKKGGSPTCVEK